MIVGNTSHDCTAGTGNPNEDENQDCKQNKDSVKMQREAMHHFYISISTDFYIMLTVKGREVSKILWIYLFL